MTVTLLRSGFTLIPPLSLDPFLSFGEGLLLHPLKYLLILVTLHELVMQLSQYGTSSHSTRLPSLILARAEIIDAVLHDDQRSNFNWAQIWFESESGVQACLDPAFKRELALTQV
jgi:hypothetical protein